MAHLSRPPWLSASLPFLLHLDTELYQRVSTKDQNLDLQLDALMKAGCDIIYKEKASGKIKDRPELMRLFENLQKGDTVIVWKLDRLGRSLKDLISLVTQMAEMEVNFISIQDNINTGSAAGRLVFHIFAAIAEFEREIISDRSAAGVEAARARGRIGGRKKGLDKDAWSKALAAKALYDSRRKSIAEIAKDLQIGEATVYRYINAVKASEQSNNKKGVLSK